MSAKRPLSPRSSSPSSPSSTVKALRLTPPESAMERQLLCTLPPTCNPPANRPCHLASAAELERHYATYHAHVCAEKGCGAVFPEPRLLELHQTECHDPIAALRKEKGEKIFACHLASCPKTFATPKTRRLHLIQAHGYPKEYFFAVTNKGVGGLLKKWGEGASLVRNKWAPREPGAATTNEVPAYHTPSHTPSAPAPVDRTTARDPPPHTHAQSPFRLADGPLVEDDSDADEPARPAPADDALARAVDALALVPPRVRAKAGGNAHAQGGHQQHHLPQPQHHHPQRRPAHHKQQVHDAPPGHARNASDGAMDVDGASGPSRTQTRGRGRGRAHGAAHDGSDNAPDAHVEDAEDDDDATAVEDTPRVNTRRPPMPPRGLGRGLGRGVGYGRGRIHVGGGYGRR
ncbi:hypothetical protein PsYK624_148510 [Phanerochaete sordida]|uniref:C2H2-type domain-containing protein n=1 Tax=Phanerochaete sordida TaxID=48140 RepID=A0A9P3GND7_9APHY|nr:hypothetical protein PsYK624_148510 [Phanerochaete sordida]